MVNGAGSPTVVSEAEAINKEVLLCHVLDEKLLLLAVETIFSIANLGKSCSIYEH